MGLKIVYGISLKLIGYLLMMAIRKSESVIFFVPIKNPKFGLRIVNFYNFYSIFKKLISQ